MFVILFYFVNITPNIYTKSQVIWLP